MERAAQRVAFDAALAEVGAHVRAVAVEDVQLAVLALERHQAGAEYVEAVRLAVAVLRGEAQAVPAARVTLGQGTGFDSMQATHCCSPGNVRGAAGRRGISYGDCPSQGADGIV
ncbi:hypothetical protein D3C81_1807080 [compost metagenome]